MPTKRDDEQQNGFPKGLSQPALRALASAGYTQLDQLNGVSEADLMKLHGFGPRGLEILRQALQVRGLSFAQPAKQEAK